MFRKVLPILLTFSIIFGGMIPAFASEADLVIAAVPASTDVTDSSNAKISGEKAKEIAAKFLKDYFDLEVDEKRVQTDIQYQPNSPYYFMYSPSATVGTWNINQQFDRADVHISVSITVDADSGKVTNVYRYEYNTRGDYQQGIASISEDQAKEIAEGFLKKVNPDKATSVRLEDNNGIYGGGMSPDYYFRYSRIVNGLRFDSDSISITVSGVTGKVTQYSINWGDNLSFPAVDSVIDKGSAAEKLYNEAGTNLMYTPYMPKSMYSYSPSSIKLVYGLVFKNGNFLDAKEGKMIDQTPVQIKPTKTKDLTESEKARFLEKWKEAAKSDKELSSSEAEKLIKSKISDLFGEDYEVNSVRYEDNIYYYGNANKKTWSAQFFKKGTSMVGPPTGNISIDAVTGQLLNLGQFYNMDNQDTSEFTPKLTWEQAYYKAVDIIGTYFPEKVREVKTEQTYFPQIEYMNNIKMPERNYGFGFQRVVNGIAYGNNSIYINIDIKTGNVTSINCNWDDGLVFPDTKGIIDEGTAKQALFKALGPELIYAAINKSSDVNKPDFEVKAVYTIRYSGIYNLPSYIDAKTGQLLSYNGEEIGSSTDNFKNIIKGHWAEKQLNILAYQGIIDKASFKLDGAATKYDAIKMLVNAKGNNTYLLRSSDSLKFTNISKDSEVYRYLQMAAYYGIIENTASEFKGDEKITREELAQLLVKLLKYDKLAEAKDIYSLPYSDANDISADKYGYVAVSRGLGILKGSDGKFRPKDNVTMAELAVSIYNALDSLRSTN